MRTDRIGGQVAALNNLIKRGMAAEAEATGLTKDVTGMQGLIIHYLMMSEPHDRFQKDIEAQFCIRRSTATGILQLMEQHGLLVREPVPQDARLKRLVLTDKARTLNGAIRAGMDRIEDVMRRGVDAADLTVWFAVCKQICCNLEQDECKTSEETV